MGERPGVLIYWETFDILESLNNEEIKIMLSAIKNYAHHNILPDFADNRLLATLWLVIQQRLDADEQRYKDICVKRVQAGKKGAEQKKQMQANATKCEQMLPSASNDKQIKPTTTQLNYNSTTINYGDTERKRTRFVPPTLDEVKAYCLERNNSVDAERFFDYYSTNGWVQGKGKPIKDWKACVRTWENNTMGENAEKTRKRVYKEIQFIGSDDNE